MYYYFFKAYKSKRCLVVSFFLFLHLMGFEAFLKASEESSEVPQKTCEEVFTLIYDQAIWGINEDGLPGSGYGSHSESNWLYIEFLVEFMNIHQIRSIVDLGCGDWCFSRCINWNSARYIGVDVVKSVIERNQALYTTSNISFMHGDMLNMDLPDADLLLCKDVLMHLPNEDIESFLSKIGKYQHCLFTHDITKSENFSVELVNENMDLPVRGGFRPLDLTKHPFNLKGTKIFTWSLTDGCVKQALHLQN